MCEQLVQGRYLVVERLGIEPATCRTQVRCRNHYNTKPHEYKHIIHLQQYQKLMKCNNVECSYLSAQRMQHFGSL